MICQWISVKPVKYKNLKKFDVFTPYDSEILEYAENNGDIDNLLDDIDRYFKLSNDIAIYMWDGIYNKVEQESFKPNDLVLQLIDI